MGNVFGGFETPAAVAPENTGVQQPAVTTQQPQVQPQVNPTQQPQGGYQGTPQAQPQPNQQEVPDHVKRSMLASAEQTWNQKNSTAIQLEQAIRAMGRDPSQVLQQVQEAQRQAQIEAQQAQGISPQLAQQMEGLGQQVQSLQQVIGQQRLQEAERNLTTYASKFGVDYSNPQTQTEVRQFALENNVNLDFAFRHLYFDRITQVAGQQVAGQQIAAMQGRAPQPASSAVAGNNQQGPTNYLNMSDADFEAAARRVKAEYNQR